MGVQHRAYSLLQVKSIDEDNRVIVGMASTPETDRSGDIMEPKGAEFTLPLPFLWHHDRQNPIGEVFFANVSAKGIEIKARVANVGEPGLLKDRLDLAWQSIKARLVRGLSIGFQPLEAERIGRTAGFHVTKWRWFDLSAVTVPDNAHASIQSIKSFDVGLAASGTEAEAELLKLSGASEQHRVAQSIRQGRSMKTISEQIQSFEATRQAKAARMTEIMTKAGEDGVTLDVTQTEEYDGLEADVKSIDAHLVRLAALEKANKAAAVPVNGTSAENALVARTGAVISVEKKLPPGIEFSRYAMCLMTANGNRAEALEIAKARYPDNPRIHNVLQKAVSAGTTTSATWAGPLVQYQDFMGDFIEYLRPQTIIGKFGTGTIPALRSVPFNIRVKRQTAGMTGYWVGQGVGKPVTAAAFDTVLMTWAKVAAISVITEELARFSSPSAEALVRDELAGALIAKLDTDFVDPAKAIAANVSPASITNGITPVSATGTNYAAFVVDVQALMAGFITANISPAQGVWIMSATRALAMSLMQNALSQPQFPGLSMQGGTLIGYPVIVSEYVTTGSSPNTDLMIFVNASDIYLADDGQVVVDVSREASLEMTATPSQNAATPTESSVVSLWQTNSIGLRAERFINWLRRRDAAVAYISNAAYT